MIRHVQGHESDQDPAGRLLDDRGHQFSPLGRPASAAPARRAGSGPAETRFQTPATSAAARSPLATAPAVVPAHRSSVA
ncbi:MAG: hypothetical protein J2P46_16025, partial [Zavarzinella sp.]|nr:hypothetical protein [Zavarzinella sp.]